MVIERAETETPEVGIPEIHVSRCHEKRSIG